MMKHSPGTARDLHHRLADWWGSAHAEQLISAWADLPGDKWSTALQRSALLAADTYLVTDEMSALCRQAGFALPYLSPDPPSILVGCSGGDVILID